jgi:hypothetical protein
MITEKRRREGKWKVKDTGHPKGGDKRAKGCMRAVCKYQCYEREGNTCHFRKGG